MNDTIFQKIIRREIPATIVYEDNECIAFLDIHPVRKGHVLLLPKEGFTWFEEVPDGTIEKIFVLAKKLASAMKASLSAEYIQIVIEGVEVPHFHIHLIPGKVGVKNAEWHHEKYEEGEMVSFAEKIKSAL